MLFIIHIDIGDLLVESIIMVYDIYDAASSPLLFLVNKLRLIVRFKHKLSPTWQRVHLILFNGWYGSLAYERVMGDFSMMFDMMGDSCNNMMTLRHFVEHITFW